jgi:RNA polymerase sporulation-specific sigma factor
MYEILLTLARGLLFFAGYVNSPGTFPEPLPIEEETEAILKAAKGDIEARNKLVEHNLRLVAHIAKKYASNGREQDDLISIGTIGLIKGVTTYNPQKGFSLATYASKCIENEILMSIRAEKKIANEISLNEPMGCDKDGNEISVGDRLGSEPDAIHDEVALKMASEGIRELIRETLTDRERNVIELRYGLIGASPMPQREVAKLLGISRSYVSRIETKAIDKLRAIMRDSEISVKSD